MQKFLSFEINQFLYCLGLQVVKPIDWKWIAIGVGCGFLLLIIIIIVLWLCGFFKRYRPYAEAKVVKQQSGQPHETERLCESY